MKPKIELKVGMRFGRLVTHTKSVKSFWLCYCDCGSLKEVTASALWGGNTKSCGCLKREVNSDRMYGHSGDVNRFVDKEVRRSSDSIIEE
jgi:hypothetical protein